MSLVTRVKNILLSPDSEWQVIAKEPATVGGIMTGYVIPVAGIAAAVGLLTALLGGAFLASIPGMGAVAGVSFLSSLISSAVGFALTLLLVVVMGYLCSALAPSFGGQADPAQGVKLIAYAGTPVWVAQYIPILGILLALIGLIYACYLIVIGTTSVLGVPEDKKATAGVIILLIYFVAAIVVYFINSLFSVAGSVATAAAM